MSIQFVCPHCNHVLRVASGKSGKKGKCPYCRQAVTVPSEEEAAAAMDRHKEASPSSKGEDPFSKFVVYDEQDFVFQKDGSRNHRSDAWHNIDFDKIAVSRRVITIQGILLGLLALLSLILGFALGRFSAPQGQTAFQLVKPCNVSGTVEYKKGDQAAQPDIGAVVILLPKNASIDERLDMRGLRPLDPMPDKNHAAVRAIIELGGNYGRVGRDGRFHLRTSRGGDYYLLTISRNRQRRETDPFIRSNLAEIGRYFSPALDLIGNSQIAWQLKRIRGDQKLATIVFE